MIQQHLTPASHQIMPKSLPNGDIQSNGGVGVGVGGHMSVAPKKILHPYHDTRIDLMEAIRHGKSIVEEEEEGRVEHPFAYNTIFVCVFVCVSVFLKESL